VKTIIVKTQAEWDALPDSFEEWTEIHIRGKLTEICRAITNAEIHVGYSATINYVGDSATIKDVRGSATINYVGDSATINYVGGSATINYVGYSATINYVGGSATINYVGDSATIKDVRGSATINYVRGSATIKDVRGSATIKDVRGSATINYVGDSATIKDVGYSATINYVGDSATIKDVGYSATIKDVRDSATIKDVRMNAVISQVRSKSVIIERLSDYATVICIDEKCTIKKQAKTASVIVCPRVLYDIKLFADIYKDNLVGKNKITLYKSVNPGTLCDFYTGKIKYEGTVTCPDFDPNPERECGDGLHLSPTPEMALRYNEGKVLKCEVALKDIVVYGHNIDKVRCRKVKVIGEA
jgi:hypothetical protein